MLSGSMTGLGSLGYMWYSRCSNGYGTELVVNYQPAIAAGFLAVMASDSEKAHLDSLHWKAVVQ
jgi:hypothetical protein